MPMNPRLLRPTASGLDPDALAWRAAVIAAGSSVDGGVVAAVSRFVKGCKSDGIWDAMKSVVLLAGADTLAGALAPLKGTAPTSYNFVSGDYSQTSGLVGNGSTKYLDSNRANNADPQDSNHMAVWVHTAHVSGVGGYLGADDGSAGANRIAVSIAADSIIAKSRCSTGSAVAGQGAATGFVGVNRSSGTSFFVRSSGTNNETVEASQTPSTGNVLAYQRGGGFPSYATARLSFYSIGESLDLALLDARVSALMTNLGVS